MEESNKISRNKFVKIIGGLALLPVGYFLFNVFKDATATPDPKFAEETISTEDGVVIKEAYIIVRKNGKTSVFSSMCTHMQCNVNSVRNDLMVCPCHGSKFDLDGNVITGPARRNLDKLKFTESGNKIKIDLNS